MKTSNLVALIIALLVSTGGFEGINYLFTHASSEAEQSTAAVTLHA